MTPVKRLVATGELLFGKNNWQGMLAEELEIDRETLRKWVTGKRPYPAMHVDQQLAEIIETRIKRLEDLRRQFDESAATFPRERSLPPL